MKEIDSKEKIVDMFAAVGNLSLQPLFYKKNKSILIEKSKYTFNFLKKTIERNKINSAQLINNDCRDVNIENYADRVFLGYHNVDATHINKALELSKETSLLHLHPLAKPGNYNELVERYTRMINNKSIDAQILRIDKIKNYSPGLHHI